MLTETTIPLPVVYAQESFEGRGALHADSWNLRNSSGTKKDFDAMYQQLTETEEKTESRAQVFSRNKGFNLRLYEVEPEL